MVQVRRMLPAKRNDPPEWEISVDGVVIGWIVQWKPPRGRTVFYRATVIHPGNGKLVGLESDPDFDNRVHVIEEFHRDPATGRAHYREISRTTPPARPSSSQAPTSP